MFELSSQAGESGGISLSFHQVCTRVRAVIVPSLLIAGLPSLSTSVAAIGEHQSLDIAVAVRRAAEGEAEAEQFRRVVHLPRDRVDFVEGRGGRALAGRLLAEVEAGVQDRDIGLHRDGVGLAIDLHVGQERLPHAAAETLDTVEDIGQIHEPVLADE